MSKLPVSVIILILVAGILLIREIGASVPTLKGKGSLRKELTWAQSLSGSSDTLYTVPEGKTFVVTDFTVSNTGSGVALALITRGSAFDEASALIPVPSNGSIHYSFNIGPTIPAGKNLTVLNLGSGSVNYFVSGYLVK